MLRIQYFREFRGISYSITACVCPCAHSSQAALALSSEMGCVGYLRELVGTVWEYGAEEIVGVCMGRGEDGAAFLHEVTCVVVQAALRCQKGKT